MRDGAARRQHALGDILAGDAVDQGDVEAGQRGGQHEGVAAVGARGEVDGVDVLELEREQPIISQRRKGGPLEGRVGG